MSTTFTNKRAPRQADGASTPSKSPATSARYSPNPNNASRVSGNSTPRRFSGSVGSPARTSPGTVLYVQSLSSQSRARGADQSQASASFRSKTTFADAHIKDVQRRMTGVAYRDLGDKKLAGGTAAFRASSPSDRDSHMRDLMNRTYGSPRSTSGSPNHKRELNSASFRSASPSACAHINAHRKPIDASYEAGGMSPRGGNSASFRSQTTTADAHIKAMTKFGEGVYQLSPANQKGATSPFKSTTSIADAHIRALTKPVDLCVAYRD